MQERYMRLGIIAGFVLILLGIALFSFYELHVRSEKGAARMLRKGKLIYERGTKEAVNKSIEVFTDIISNYPNTQSAVESFYYIGKCYEKLGLNRLAYLKYVYLLKNNRDLPASVHAEIRTRIARLRVQRNYSEEGIHQLLTLLKFSSNRDFRSRVYTELGHAYLKMGKHRKSRRMFNIALSENGSNEDAILGKARTLKRLGYAHKAYDLYEYYLKYYANFSNYSGDVKRSYHNQVYNSGYYSYTRGKYHSAISYFKRYLRNFPYTKRSENAYYWIGESYFMVRNYSKALRFFSKVLSNTYGHKNQDARMKRGYIYFISKKYDLAAREFQIYINHYPHGRHITTAKRWKKMSTKELLYQIKNRSLPEHFLKEKKERSGLYNNKKQNSIQNSSHLLSNENIAEL